METYRVSSRIRELDREYLVQTVNDSAGGAVMTTVYVDGVPAETIASPHPAEIDPEEVLSFVKVTHDEKKKELESLLHAYRDSAGTADPHLLFHLGTAFYYKGFHIEAKALFNDVTRLNPDNHQAFNLLSATMLALGDVKGAVATAESAVNRRPGYADYRNNLAEALLAANDTAGAIAQLEEAIAINMYYSDAYFNLGLAHLLNAVNKPDPRQLPTAVRRISEFFHRASLIYANFRSEAFEEGMQALRNHDLVRAMGTFKRIREEKKEKHRQEFSSFYMKFVLYPDWVTSQAVAERIAYLEDELRRNPTYVDLHDELAHCYFEQARLYWQDGIDRLRRTADLNPTLTRVTAGVEQAGRVYDQMGEAIKRISQKGS